MDKQTSMPSDIEPILAWSAVTVPVRERSKQWYMVGGVIVLAGAAYGIITGSWSLTIVVVLCGAMYYLMRNHTPTQKSIAFFQRGVLFEGAFVRWEDLSAFWVIETPQYAELHITRQGNGKPIVIHTGDVPIQDAKMVIAHFLPEQTDKHEHLIDTIIRICKL